MDKSWMSEPRLSNEYIAGVDVFINFAVLNNMSNNQMRCPCLRCMNGKLRNKDIVYEHLRTTGISPTYTRWIYHGENSHASSSGVGPNEGDNQVTADMPVMMTDLFRGMFPDIEIDHHAQSTSTQPNAEAEKFIEYMEDANKPLYEGANISKLAFIVRMFHLKCKSGWTHKSFDEMLDIFRDTLPLAKLPRNFSEMKKIVSDLGFGYTKIHACPNDCMLYWTEEELKLDRCTICSKSRWKVVEKPLSDSEGEELTVSRKEPQKVLRYFSIKKRLQRLFLSSKTAESMTWHHTDRTKDGVLRHPADSEEWKNFDRHNDWFGKEPRNIRLGLSADGVEPFNHGPSHSIWPVTLVVYNLPPWMCMKQPFIQMPLLIPGPGSPSNNIDVYLRPLIDELKELWEEGIDTYDAYKKETFRLHAVLMWTINDFPAYAMMAGWSTKGYMACPICQENTHSFKLPIAGNTCYTGHRRFLDANHAYRKMSRPFDGKTEHRPPPPIRSGQEIFEEVQHIHVIFGKTTTDTVPNSKDNNWRKRSIFFDLPYWKELSLRHNLDVMHIEKNVCELLLGTLLNTKWKSKDTLQVRHALQNIGLRPELHPHPKGSGRWELPPACFNMSVSEKRSFLQVLKDVKVPDGYSSNISRCVNVKERKLTGLKSHDFHIIMQQLLPVALRVLPSNDVVACLTGLCHFFRELCSKEYSVVDFQCLDKKIAPILCRIEMLFPPSVFTVMLHLTVHLAREACLGGPVNYRWMYPFERFMFKLKGYIRNRSRPEGSIAEGFLAEECMTFCSLYLEGVDTTFNKLGRNEDNVQESVDAIPIFRKTGKVLGAITHTQLLPDEQGNIHRYVLFNCKEVDTFIGLWNVQHIRTRRRRTPREIDKDRFRQFPDWFKNQVQLNEGAALPFITEDIRALAHGPSHVVQKYNGYVVHGYRFHTESRECNRKFQNSGVCLSCTTKGYSSSRDRNPAVAKIDYFGILQEIIEVDYHGSKVVIFKCKWYDMLSGNGHKVENGVILLDSSKLDATSEPYILANQAQQVFYVPDPRDPQWHAAITTTPRDYYNMGDSDVQTIYSDPPITPFSAPVLDVENTNLTRNDIEAEIINQGAESERRRSGRKAASTQPTTSRSRPKRRRDES